MLSNPALLIVTMILYVIFILLFEIGATVAVVNDSKGRGIKERTLWIVLTVLCPTIVPIIYYFKKDTLVSGTPKICTNCSTFMENERFICPNCGCTETIASEIVNKDKYLNKSKKWSKIAIISFILALIFFAGAMVMAVQTGLNSDSTEDYPSEPSEIYHYAYDVDGIQTYYDLKGNTYTNPNDVLYYDRFGNTYSYDMNKNAFINGRIEYKSILSHVDTDGYFVYDANHNFHLYEDSEDSLCKEDDNGNLYYYADFISWDKDGNMVDSFTGEAIF